MASIETIFEYLEKEKQRQAETIELIASENFVSEKVLRAVGSCLTNKYAEGYPGNRYYGGCTYVDAIERICREEWQKVFKTNYHVNVQPHSGSQANYAAFAAVLNPGDTILSMNLDNGGHLTHGSHVNFSGKLYNIVFYGTDENGFIDMNDVYAKAKVYRPKLILAGASAYPRIIDFHQFRKIAYEFGALLMVDMAHIAGLVAVGLHPSPFDAECDIITTTTHKTLRGPRGGIIFCKPELAKKIDSAVFPGSQGGPLEHVIAGKAVAAIEAQQPEFADYISRVVSSCESMARRFRNLGYDLVTGGTDNHLLLLDLTKQDVTGKYLQDALDTCNITLNKNCVPGEKRSPMITSGVRIGTAAMTTRGLGGAGFMAVASIIDRVVKSILANQFDAHFADEIKNEVKIITQVLNDGIKKSKDKLVRV